MVAGVTGSPHSVDHRAESLLVLFLDGRRSGERERKKLGFVGSIPAINWNQTHSLQLEKKILISVSFHPQRMSVQGR